MNSMNRQVLAAGRWRVARVCIAGALVLLAGCGERKNLDADSPAAAKVNKGEVKLDQIMFVLQRQPGLKTEQVDAAGRKILERLIDQELAVQQAADLKLDRDPKVVQQIEAARREVIARAYVEHVGEAAAKPTAEEVQKYFDAKPALFKDRRIYSLQEIDIEAKPDQVEGLRAKLAAARNIAEFVEYLKAGDFRFVGSQAVRTAEQLPLASLDVISKMKDGATLFNASPSGAQVLLLAGSRAQPVSLEQARPAIEQFVLNERKRKLIDDDLKALRAKSRIEYVGKFAVAASGPAEDAPAEAAASAATH